MVNIFDVELNPERSFLEQLAEDLHGTLSLIAYVGMSADEKFIRERQKEIKKQYSPYLADVSSDIGIFHVLPAYDTLQDILTYGTTPEQRQQLAEDCIFDHLIGVEDAEHVAAFEDFNENYS